MKKIILLTFVFSACANAAMAESNSTWPNSSGYYEISDATTLNNFASLVNNATSDTEYNAIVTADITDPVTFTPIGSSQEHRYKGSFNGNGHTITLSLNNPTNDYQGLFGCVGNCTIENVSVAGSVTGRNYVGGIVGQIHTDSESITTTISNCHNNAAVILGSNSDNTTNAGRTVGGIVGIINCQTSSGSNTNGGKVTISGCTNSGSVTGSSRFVGGIVGYASSDLTLQKCLNSGTITAPQKHGGLLGSFYSYNRTRTLTIDHCANVGSVTVSEGIDYTTVDVGSLVGYIEGIADVTDCYNAANTGYKTIGNCLIRVPDDSGAYTNNSTSTDPSDIPVKNCYDACSYRNADFTECSSDDVKSGKLCWLLNNSATDNYSWYQNLSTDSYPILTTDDTESNAVFKCTKYSGTSSADGYFNKAVLDNTDQTVFYLVDASTANKNAITYLGTETAKNSSAVNIIYDTSSDSSTKSYYCNNVVLKSGTPYNIGVDYTAAKFTFDGKLNTGVTTFILPAAISVDKVNGSVYKLSKYTNDNKWPLLTYSPVSGTLEANMPYLVWTTENTNSDLLKETLTDLNVKAMNPVSVTVTNDNNATQYGSYTGVSISSYDTTTSYYKETVKSDNSTIVAFGKTEDTTPTPFSTMISTNDANSVLWLKLETTLTGIESVTAESRLVDVYTINGIKVRSQVDSANALTDLPAGIYIVGSRKMFKN